MSEKTKVNIPMLEQAADNIEGLVETYEKQYKKVFEIVLAIEECWKGEDTLAFVNQVKGFEGKFEDMAKTMRSYAQFLADSAKAYRNAQQQVKQAAKKLVN